MADRKQTKSTSTRDSKDTGFKFCCGDSEEMSQMMRKFCSNQDATFDFRKMMKMMRCAAPEKSDNS